MNRDERFDLEQLSAYLDGELPPEDVAAIEAALERDAELRDHLAQLEEISATLRDLPPLHAPLSILAGVREELSPRRGGLPQFGSWAALFLVAMLGVLGWQLGGERDGAPQVSQLEESVVDEIEMQQAADFAEIPSEMPKPARAGSVSGDLVPGDSVRSDSVRSDSVRSDSASGEAVRPTSPGLASSSETRSGGIQAAQPSFEKNPQLRLKAGNDDPSVTILSAPSEAESLAMDEDASGTRERKRFIEGGGAADAEGDWERLDALGRVLILNDRLGQSDAKDAMRKLEELAEDRTDFKWVLVQEKEIVGGDTVGGDLPPIDLRVRVDLPEVAPGATLESTLAGLPEALAPAVDAPVGGLVDVPESTPDGALVGAPDPAPEGAPDGAPEGAEIADLGKRSEDERDLGLEREKADTEKTLRRNSRGGHSDTGRTPPLEKAGEVALQAEADPEEASPIQFLALDFEISEEQLPAALWAIREWRLALPARDKENVEQNSAPAQRAREPREVDRGIVGDRAKRDEAGAATGSGQEDLAPIDQLLGFRLQDLYPRMSFEGSPELIERLLSAVGPKTSTDRSAASSQGAKAAKRSGGKGGITPPATEDASGASLRAKKKIRLRILLEAPPATRAADEPR